MGTIAAAVLAPHSKRPPKAADFMLKPPQTQRQKDRDLKAAMRRAGKPRKSK